ncbi:hypothetical protein LTR15_012672 [Elasticomyces elasticus]|nr:hypothetical protein LTR15_012672 [Elasticomyces elasticus]
MDTLREALDSFSIAERMSWASQRKTSRSEDVAYSLLGIFDVNMTLLYGEGSHAFIRLQEEIIKKSTDFSIFAWGHRISEALPERKRNYGLLAEHPDEFRFSGTVLAVDPYARDTSEVGFDLTNQGLKVTLPIVSGRGGGWCPP